MKKKKKNNKQVISHKIKNDVLELFKKTRLYGEYVDFNLTDKELLKKAKEQNIIHTIDKNISVCAYKSEIDEKDYILLLFKLSLPGQNSNSSSSTKIIMELVSSVEYTLTEKYNMKISQIRNNKKTNTQCLRVWRDISSEEDVI